MPGAKSVPAAPTAYSPVAAPIPRTASAAPALRSSLTAPARLTIAAMLRGSGEKDKRFCRVLKETGGSCLYSYSCNTNFDAGTAIGVLYATSPGARAPSIGPSTSESSTLASSLAQLPATSLSQLPSASLAQRPETLARSESSAGHDSTSVQHAQLQALHLVNAPPVRSPGVHPDVQYAKALVQRRKSTGMEHKRCPNEEVLRVSARAFTARVGEGRGERKMQIRRGKRERGITLGASGASAAGRCTAACRRRVPQAPAATRIYARECGTAPRAVSLEVVAVSTQAASPARECGRWGRRVTATSPSF